MWFAAVTCLTAVYDILGLNFTVGTELLYDYHKCHGHGPHAVATLPRSNQHSNLCGLVQ